MLWDAALVVFIALALGAAFGAVPLTGILRARRLGGCGLLA
jgi:hypothetical protein